MLYTRVNKLNILGIGDGPASFNAVMASNNRNVTSVDPLYQFSADQIRVRIKESFDDVLSQTENNKEKFCWNSIKNIKELGEIRMAAMNIFLEDYDRGKTEGRYVFGNLPKLNFKDSSFDLIISSHLLFLYSDLLDLDFHIKSVLEMLRIANEVRIFPILDTNGDKSKHYDPVYDFFQTRDFRLQLKKVHYEFQVNGNEILVISKKS